MATEKKDLTFYQHLIRERAERRARRPKELEERAIDMAHLFFDEKWTYSQIGRKHGLTRQRVYQIISSLGK